MPERAWGNGRRYAIYVFVFLLFGVVLSAHAQEPTSIDNPVLDSVADSGVLKYNGEYYLMGVGTDGGMYQTSDLVDWRGPTHAFSMNNDWTPGPAAQDRRIHASDFAYVNGTFHHYWSVNYWGEPRMTVRIGHATADSVLGPYSEPVPDTWFDSRIDAHLFVDRDGTPYFYSVKFGDDNVIYGQKMADPWTRVGTPRFLLSAHSNTWETRAESINEGPEVDWYRGRYYMLYAANHVVTKWGQYAIGAAEADHPLGFNNATKYDHPVLGPTNEDRITAAATVHVPIGTSRWRYTTTPPTSADWTRRGFDDNDWSAGRAAFGSRTVENSTTNRTTTDWSSGDLWLRKTIQLDEPPSEHLQLLMRLRGRADIYVNGERIHRSDGVRYYATIDVGDVRAFRAGENVIAVHAQQTEDDRRYVDVGLIDPKTHPGEAYIFSPGQPSLVRGPNGFEWWLVYFARYDGGPKSQAVDRVHFFDDKLYVDGPTAPHTPGFPPPPRLPTVRDLFEDADRTRLGAPWQVDEGAWTVQSGEVRQTRRTGRKQARIEAPAGTNLLFQAGLRFSGGRGGRVGVVLEETDGDGRLSVALNRAEGTWQWRRGDADGRSFALPSDFDFSAYHRLRLTKNAGHVRVSIDGRPAPGTPGIETELDGTVRPGLFTDGAAGTFDGVTYTRGWDEYDAEISGWRASDGEGAWRTDSTGLHQTEARGAQRAVKGDALERYEFSAQVYGELRGDAARSESRHMGILPVYIDEANWLRAAIDPARHHLVVEQMRDGTIEERWTVELADTKRLYPDANYSDQFATRYTLRSATLLDSLQVTKMEHGDSTRHPLPASWIIERRRDGQWRSVSSGERGSIRADALRIDRGTDAPEIGPLYARIECTSTYNLRAVKRSNEVILFVDGEQVLRVPGQWPAARVGLETRGMMARFDGLQRFHIPTPATE
jgi:GH43 family beta-xylosidase